MVVATSDRRVMEHFVSEYGAAAGPAVAEPEVEVTFGPVGSPLVEGGHKSVRWRVSLDPPVEGALRLRIQLTGAPKGFGLSLVQGYFVEPVLSLAAARVGVVLLPCAAIATAGDGLMLLMGRSRSGKSSLAVRALAAGGVVFGDDQAFVDAQCRCSRFPRRMRFYADVRRTAPRAFARLRPAIRAKLRALAGVRAVSRGVVAPPVRVPIEDLGIAGGLAATEVRRVVVLERVDDVAEIVQDHLGPEQATGFALELLDDQRRKLMGASPEWDQFITMLRDGESATLRNAFQVHAVERLRVPSGWAATDALPVLGHLLRLPS